MPQGKPSNIARAAAYFRRKQANARKRLTTRPPRPSAPCRHCGGPLANRPRGLCWGCYHAPGVRDNYQPTSKYACRGVADSYGPRPLPAQPTAAAPGSAEKIRVLEERAARGEQLWHPQDAGWEIEVEEEEF
jgi:hypothetical protein